MRLFRPVLKIKNSTFYEICNGYDFSHLKKLTNLDLLDSLTLKNIGPSSANQCPSTAVTHCMYSYGHKYKIHTNKMNNSP